MGRDKDSEKKKPRYYETDSDKIQKKLEELGTGTFFKPKEGKNIVRILPPWSKEGIWYKEATLHYGLKNESGKERAYPCLKMFGDNCPICDKRDELVEGGEEDKKLADQLRPRTKYYANVLERTSGKVMIWGFSAKTLSILLSYTSDPDYGDISDPQEGFDVVIERTGTGRLDTRYQIRVKPKPSEVEEIDELVLLDLDKEVVDEISEEDLEEIVEQNFGEGIAKKKKNKKVEDDEDDEEDEDDKPKKKRNEDED